MTTHHQDEERKAGLPEGIGELFAEMANDLPLILWVQDAAGRLVVVNDAFCAYFGVDREQAEGTPWPMLLHPEDRPAHARALSACIREGRALHTEVRVRRGDGEWRWLSSQARPRFSRSGAFRGLVGTSTDVTDSKRAEAADRRRADRDRFRAALGGALESAGSPEAIEAAATRLSRAHFAADGCCFLRPLDGGPNTPLVVTGEADDPAPPPELRAALAELGARSFVLVPVADGEDRAALVVHARAARAWSHDEVRLVREVAERTGAAAARVRAEAALRRSRERYRTLLESVEEGFCVFKMLFDESGRGIDYRFLEVNSTFERHTGLVDAVGRRARELVPDLEDRWPEIYGRVATTGAPHHFIEGSEAMGRVFRVSASRVGAPEDHEVALIFTDITEARRREKALRESEERLRLASSFAGLGVFSWDVVEDTVRWDNDRMYEIFDRPRAEGPASLGELESRYLAPEDRGALSRALDAAMTGDVSLDVAVRVRRPSDGRLRWVALWGRFEREPDGAPRRLVGVVADVTERKRTEATLRESNARKDEFLAMLGHELRNPLGAIRTAAELVERQCGDDPQLERVAAVLTRQSGHMAGLIEGLLEVSRVARGKMTLSRERLDLRGLVEAVVDDRRAELDEKRLDLQVSLPAAPVHGDVDRVRWTQIVDNLLANAIKFTPAPGTVAVRLEARDGEAVLTVRDSGVGIAPERLASIFEPFHQEAQDVARGQGGLGLGLALAQGLVALHGGHIEALSDGPGHGATLEVRLPIAAEGAPAAKAPAAKAPARRQAGRSVLVVEDSPDNAEMLRAMLELQGFRPSTVATGPAALERLREAPPDAVLCDIGLPGMDGHALARTIRADPELQDLPLVALTGYGQPGDRQRSSEAGFSAHLTKPVEADALLETLGQLLDARD
jgi:PAS domain S-box-containing protein